MKIAFITNTFYPELNGVVISILNSSDKLSKKGHKIKIFTRKHKEKPNLHKNIEINEYISTGLLTKYPNFRIELPSLKFLRDLKDFDPDIIHVHTPTPFAFESLYFAKKNNKPIIGTYHTIAPDFLKHSRVRFLDKLNFMKKLMWFYTNLFYNRCNLVTTPSEAMKKELIKNKVKNKIIALSNGIDLKLFKKTRFNKIPKILCVGRISYEKNIDVLVEAFKKLYKKGINSKLIIAGSGPDEKRIKRICRGYNVEFFGPMDRKYLANLYSSCDIFATASTVETEGLVILEAMASGLPIVGVNRLAIPLIVEENKNGFIVEPFNSDEMSLKLEKLCNDINLRKKFGKESLKMVKKYSLDGVIKRLENIYSSLK